MTKTNIVVEKLRSDILSGVLKENSPLRETILAKRYNVGRAIVREALIILSNEGLTYSKHNFGMRVSKFSNDAIDNLVILFAEMSKYLHSDNISTKLIVKI